MLDAHPLDHESRALWHLELLGCFEPGDAVAPWVPPLFSPQDDAWADDCDEHGWGPCTSCRGTGLRRHQWVF